MVSSNFSIKEAKAQNYLTQLEALKNSAPKERWTKFRLLPMPAQLLVSAEYCYNRWNWSPSCDWNLVKFFDKELVRFPDSPWIAQTFDNAVHTQRKIAMLRRLQSSLNGESPAVQKLAVYKGIARTDGVFFNEIKHCIWAAHGKMQNAGMDFADRKIEESPDSDLHKSVISRIIFLLKHSHTDLIKHESNFTKI